MELFTSQGCSSCPPADAFLSELRALPHVVALSYHVDYWDYLGWRDTLGSAEFSQRQYDYARSRGDMNVYTPQMIVNGRQHFVGSSKAAVLDAIQVALADPPGVGMAIAESSGDFVVSIGALENAPSSTLWLMPIMPETSVKILRGEIAGREIAYHNIVRRLVPAGTWQGIATTLVLHKDSVLTPECEGCVALLQQGKAGPVLGVATWGKVGA